MIYIILGIGIFLGLLGVVVTENNAKYILAGYNTMSDEERALVDLPAFLKYFRNFHMILSVSFMVFSWLLMAFVGNAATIVFICAYPIILYGFFTFDSQRFIKGHTSQAGTRVAIAMLAFSLISVVGLLYWGFRDNDIITEEDQLRLTGPYRVNIPYDSITQIEIVDQLPAITAKANGFATGDMLKGHFVMENGEHITLMISKRESTRHFLKIEYHEGETIYFFSPDDDLDQSLKEIVRRMRPVKVNPAEM